jgi:hypothetical protein
MDFCWTGLERLREQQRAEAKRRISRRTRQNPGGRASEAG